MNSPDIRVDVGRLRHDAKKWTAAAGGARQLAAAARGLVLTAYEMSFAADETGVTRTYQQLQQRIAAVCEEGVGRLDGIASLVTTAADGFDVIDQTARDNLSGAGNLPKPPR